MGRAVHLGAMEASERIAELLAAAREGDQAALDEVFTLVYGELCSVQGTPA